MDLPTYLWLIRQEGFELLVGGIGARPEQEDRRSNRARLHRAQRNGSAHARVRPVNRKIGWA